MAHFPTTKRRSAAAMRQALADNDMLVLSGGTSKGAGDISHRIVSGLGEPGILVHGVALKPGKPLCLAVADGKPVIVLPGFPTSAIFTFHAFVAPVIRALAGLPAENCAQGQRAHSDAGAVRTGPQGIRAGRAGAGRGRHDRVSVAQGLRFRYRILAGRRFHRDRRARQCTRCRDHERCDVDRQLPCERPIS